MTEETIRDSRIVARKLANTKLSVELKSFNVNPLTRNIIVSPTNAKMNTIKIIKVGMQHIL